MKAAGFQVRYCTRVVAVALALATMGPVMAQTAHAQSVASASAPSERIYQFNIPSKPLPQAIADFSAVTGVQVLYTEQSAFNYTAPALQGRYAVGEALQQLLAGSGLVMRFTGPDAVTIESAGQGSVPSLASIRVRGQAVGPNALPTEYAGGQVATGGRLGMLGNIDFMDAPFSITSYTAELIESQQARSLANVVDNDPAVQISTRGRGTNTGGDNFRIRGFSLMSRDVSLNGLYGVLPNTTISVESVERVEIIKGPNALLGGVNPSGTVGGSINIVPKRATDEPLTRVTGIYRSDAQFGTHVDIGRRFGDANQFGVRFNGVYLDGDTAVDDQTNSLNVATLGLDYRGERLRVSADLGYQKDRVDGASGFGSGLQVVEGVQIPDAPDARNRTAQSWERTKNKDIYAALHGEYDLTPEVTLYGGVGGHNNTPYNLRTNHTLLDNEGTLSSFPVYYPEYSDTRTVMSGVRGRFTTGSVSHQLNVQASLLQLEGGYLYESGAATLSTLDNVGRIERPDFNYSSNIPKTFERRLSSIAIADTLGFLDDRVLVTLGARHQRVKVSNFSPDTGEQTSHYDEARITPSVGIAVRPWDEVTFYGNYIEGLGLGFTAPANAENAGQAFAPARTRQTEAGIKYDNGNFGSTVSLFEIRQPSLITTPGSTPGSFISEMAGEQRNRGIEWQFFGEPVRGLRLLGGVTYLQPTLVRTQSGANDGNQAPGLSRWVATMRAEWDVPVLSGLSVNARVIHSSSQYADAANMQKMPGWTRLDVGASYRMQTYPVTFRVNVENLLNKNYWESASGS
ncbi:MAG TPA: TonB-dependent siderophore receptor, partial [Pusillimonas sp.]|nr:TonB-dependent siderophore receptor [Pusillimonas sp.]